MKRNRRILSLLLAICLVIALSPVVFAAEEDVAAVSAALAESASDDQVVSFAGEEWIVIDNNSDSIVLLLRTPAGPIAYNASGLSNSWGESDAKNWCDEFEAKLDATALSAVLDNNGEKVFFLSNEEVVTYWINNAPDGLRTANGWWLRYNNEDIDSALFGSAISDAGFWGTPHVATNYGARPAIKVDASKIAAMIPNGSGVLELKVIDEGSFEDFDVGDVTVAETKDSVTVNFSDAKTGSTVHALVIDQLGKTVAYDSVSADAGAGVLSVELPNIVGRYTVRVFNELGGIASKVYENDFSIADNLGNVIEWKVNLGDDISATFNIALDSKLDEKTTKICVTSNGATREYIASEVDHDKASDGVTDCVQLTVNVLAPQMANVIQIQIVSGENLGGIQNFSIRQYGEAIVNGDFSSAAKNLVKHMLNYGANAQTYFNYNTKNLANENTGVPTQEKVPAPDNKTKAVIEGEVAGIKADGASLILNSKTTLRFYFKLTGEKDITAFDFGALTPHKRSNDDETLYFVDIDGISPHELDKSQMVTVTDKEADSKLTVSYSPVIYIQRQYHSNISKSDLAKFTSLLQAMYNYYLAADAYVTSAK